MKIFILAMLLMTVAATSRGQTISQAFVNQSVAVGQTATFTVTVTGGPCRSLWTIAGTSSWGATASTFAYTTPPATTAMNGEEVYIDLFSCTGGTTELFSTAHLTVTSNISLNVTGTLKFDDATTVYVGAVSVQQMSGSTWVSAGGINLDANGNFSGFLIVNPNLVDANGNLQLQIGIANPSVYVSQTFSLTQFQQGSTGLTITWVLWKKAPMATKSEALAFTP
jgi:hypothetical protein